MSPIDILPQNLRRPVDAQSSRDSSYASEGTEGAATPAEANGFGSLLRGLAERAPRSGANAQPADNLDLFEPVTEGKASDAGIASSVFALLQGILPNHAAPVAVTAPGANSKEGGSPSQLPLDEMLPLEESNLSNLAAAPKLTVAVRHQETHFRPVIEAMQAGLRAEDANETGTSPDAMQIDEAADKALNPVKLERQGAGQEAHVPKSSSPAIQIPMRGEAQSDDVITPPAEKQTVIGASEHTEARKALSTNGVTHGEVTNLPAETLHRIAGAIKSDLQAAGSGPTQYPQGNAAVRTISIKASDNALRVLNLQLHPAELGMVTIRMRLAGDSLEMELHVEREETAQLLRQDSEKLSALLRGSGYRPDTISIHVGDASIQDRIGTRAQADMQTQGQSFPQGGSGQGERSRNQEKQYASTRAEHHKNADEDKVLGERSPGGVYL